MFSEWVQLGKNKKGKPVYYRKKEIYTLDWQNVNLGEALIASAPFGGPIAITRNPRRATRIAGEAKPYVYIYSSAGKLLSKFIFAPSKKGVLMSMHWSDEEQLILITDEANVFVYDITGKPLKPFSFPAEVCKAKLIQCAAWGGGIAVLTKNLDVWTAVDFERPLCEKLADLRGVNPGMFDMDEAEFCMEVIPPELSVSSEVDVIIGLPSPMKSLLVVNSQDCTNRELTNGPFKKISASPQANAIASFTESGGLWVVKADFTEFQAEFNTKSKAPPNQLAWCGEDCVCLSWLPEQLGRPNSLLLMIGPHGDYNKFIYDGPIHLVTECDGVRVFTQETCEFLQRVPNATLDIFKIGSLEPAAVLYDAYREFEKKNASSIRNIRTIKEQLPKAVSTCLEAACDEFDPGLQRKLLKAASYGKSFCENFKHSEFISTLKKLRVMNAVRSSDVGIPITNKQYETLTQEVLVDRLVNRFHHLLAFKVCEYLELKPENVLVHWACAKVRSDEPDKAILGSIKSKLQQSESASYAVVASTAYRVGKKQLALDLLDYEKNAGEQVPLLLDMGETKQALKKAIESGETDLVYLVLLHMKKKLPPQALFAIINEPAFEVGRNLLITYCKEQDIDFLTTFYQALELPHEAASMLLLECFKVEDTQMKNKLLRQAKDLFSKKRENYVDALEVENQIKLLEAQNELDEAVGKKMFFGTSISETIYNCILVGQTKRASALKTDFKVPDKRYWWLKIRALAKMQRWEDLEKFAKSKKSPIGYRPFVEVCLEYDSFKVQAVKYIPKVSDPWEKVELYVALSKFKEAIETAYAERDIEMLQFIRAKSTNPQTKQTIEGLIQKLGG
jgi:hypothetical protein